MRAPDPPEGGGEPQPEPPREGSAEGAALAAMVLAPSEAAETEELGPDDGLEAWERTYSADVEAKLALIEDDMLSGRFRRGKSPRAYASAWNLTPQRVRQLTAIASKRVLAAVAHPEEVARDASVMLWQIARKAKRGGDYKSAIAALRVLLAANGAVAPKLSKTLIGVFDAREGGDDTDVSALTDDELAAIVQRKALARASRKG